MSNMKVTALWCLGIMSAMCWASCSGTSAADKKTVSAPEICTEGEVVLDNGHIRIKQDLGRGGSICYLSRSDEDRNIVNIYDEGRLIQQSYYAGKSLNRQDEGQSPSWSPWAWNPIQGGNSAGKGARILHAERTDTSLYVKCVPMLWDMNDHEAEAVMEQWTTLDGNVAYVRNKITCHRTDTIYGEGIACSQEIPAVYPISKLKNLYTYSGDQPFTGAALTSPVVECLQDGFWGRYDGKSNPVPTEKWMAFVDDGNWGLGVYTPIAETFLAGRSGDVDGEAMSVSTSYIAPLCTRALNKNSVMEYDYYLIVDSLDAIRSTVYALNSKINEQ